MAILYTSVSISALTTFDHLFSQVKLTSVQNKVKKTIGYCVDKWIHRKSVETEVDSDDEAASLLPQFLPNEVGFDSQHYK